jgi:phosphoribosylformylglycinamidine cyclo-ligase
MSTYEAAGVDIEAGDLAVQLMKSHLAKARRPEVIGEIGGFAGLFDVSALKNFTRPLLATSTDGVGTKTEIARLMGKYDTIGEDLVAMVVDDLVVCGAEPLFMTDYIAVGKVFPTRIAEIVSGIAVGCQKAGTALVGGETAEHPGLLGEDEFDIAGAATGAVDYDNLLGEHLVQEGDVLIAMAASGLHANGYSLVRHILKTKNLRVDQEIVELGGSLGEALLTPTEIYSLDCLALHRGLKDKLHGYSHITGGGLAANTARVIPAHLTAKFDRSTWSLPLIMEFLAQQGGVAQPDMEKTWNVGVGMVAIVARDSADLALRSLAARGMNAWVCGVVERRTGLEGSILEGTYQAR